MRQKYSFDITIDEQAEDLLVSWRAMGTVASQRRAGLFIGVFFGLLMFVALRRVEHRVVISVATGLFILLVRLATVERVLRRVARRTLARIQGGDIPVEMEVELSDDRFTMRRQDSEQSWKWAALASLSDDPDAVRVMSKRFVVASLPRRIFHDDREAEECLAYLQQRSGLPVTHRR